MSIEVAPQNLAPVFLDTVYLRELHVSAVVVPDAWGRPGKTQPVTINIELQMNTLATGNSDDLQNSFSYGQMSKDIISTVDGKEFASVNNLMTGVVDAARMWPGQYIHCRIRLPKAFLRVDTGFSSHFSLNKQPTGSWALNSQKWAIEGIKAACIIGLNAHERLEKQAVSIHLLVALDTSDPEEMTKPIVIERWQALVKEVLKARLVPYPCSQRQHSNQAYRWSKIPNSRHLKY